LEKFCLKIEQEWKVLVNLFPNAFFVILHTSLALMFIHHKHKSIMADANSLLQN